MLPCDSCDQSPCQCPVETIAEYVTGDGSAVARMALDFVRAVEVYLGKYIAFEQWCAARGIA